MPRKTPAQIHQSSIALRFLYIYFKSVSLKLRLPFFYLFISISVFALVLVLGKNYVHTGALADYVFCVVSRNSNVGTTFRGCANPINLIYLLVLSTLSSVHCIALYDHLL